MLFNIGILLEGTPVTNNIEWLFLSYILAFSLMMSRFIIGVRELYDCDIRARCQGIDTGFGVFSQPTASGSMVVSAIAFAAVAGPGRGQGQAAEGEEEDSVAIRLEALRDGSEVVEGDGDDESEAIRVEPRGDGEHQV